MIRRRSAAAAVVTAALLMPLAVIPVVSAPADATGQPGDVPAVPAASAEVIAELERRVHSEGSVRVIVGLETEFTSEGSLGAQHAAVQRARIDRAVDDLARDLAPDAPAAPRAPRAAGTPDAPDAPDAPGTPRQLGTLPYVSLEVDAEGLARLLASPHAASVEEDVTFRSAIAESVPFVDAPEFWDSAVDGSGWAVAVLDSGVDVDHVLLDGRVVAEACFSTGGSGRTSLCPEGGPVQIGAGAAEPCDTSVSSICGHGTHVAGVVAADFTTSQGVAYQGVAKGADVIAVQVFHTAPCSPGTSQTCLSALLSDIIAALQHVASLADTIPVAAVNLSLGGGEFTTACDASFQGLAEAVADLRGRGVGVIAAAGNEGFTNALSAPACLSGVVSVGSTDLLDAVSSFSNAHPTLLDLMAPGSDIRSAFPGDRLAQLSGTSFSAPHVAGAWALMRAADPDRTPDDVLAALTANGVVVTDTRGGGSVPYLRLALTGLAPDVSDPPGGTGLLRVTTSPAVVSAIRADGVLRSDWGIDWVSVEAGEYEVCFGDVPGFATPACEDVTVVAGQTTVVEGVFAQLGLLKVDVLPSGLPATVFVDGEWRDEYGSFFYLEAGTYTVCWGDVAEHQAPACQSATVTPGTTTTVVGTFTPAADPTPGPAPAPDTFGYLRVTTSPAVPSRISVGGIVRGDWGLTWVKVPVGDHEVCFSGVPGFTAPSCRTVTVVEGETTTTVGAFVRLGLLRVDVEPSVAVDIVVDGIARNQFGLFVFTPAGTYEVCGTDIAGQVTPACRSVSVVADSLSLTVLGYVDDGG